jgi:hypothetical protein
MGFVLWLVIVVGSALVGRRLLARTAREVPSAHGSVSGTADDVAQTLNQWDALRGVSSPGHNDPWDGVDRLKALDNNGGL